MYTIHLLNLLLLIGCWGNPTILVLAILVNLIAMYERKIALANRRGR